MEGSEEENDEDHDIEEDSLPPRPKSNPSHRQDSIKNGQNLILGFYLTKIFWECSANCAGNTVDEPNSSCH